MFIVAINVNLLLKKKKSALLEHEICVKNTQQPLLPQQLKTEQVICSVNLSTSMLQCSVNKGNKW